MKVTGIILLLIIGFNAYGQRYSNAANHDTSHYLPPKFLDTKKFETDIICQGGLKSIYDSLKKDTSLLPYTYWFLVTKSGKVKTMRFYGATNKDTHQLTKYINNTFKKYKWEPSSKKGCPKCIYFELRVFFRTDSNEIHLRILRHDSNSEIKLYHKNILYEDLNSYFTEPDCICCTKKEE